jgi:intracellular sulfur oxidation DsrE/DsrF family protein
MKKTLLMTALLFTLVISYGQNDSGVVDKKEHKLVMQFTKGDSVEQETVLTQVGNIIAAWPNAKIEVVCHGSGLDLLVFSKAKFANRVADLTTKGVVFAACNNSMKRRKVKKEDLLQAATVVPSAMVELASKQEQNWSYVKGGQ